MRILKLLTLLAMLAGIGAAQCGKMVPNPLTGLQDCVGTGGGATGPTGPTGPTGAAGSNGAAYGTGGGTAQAQTVTTTPPITSLIAGLEVCWTPTNANTATAPTLAVSGLAAATITKLGGTALSASDLKTTAVACAIYDGTTNFELQNPQTSPAAGAGGSGNQFQYNSSGALAGASELTNDGNGNIVISYSGTSVNHTPLLNISPTFSTFSGNDQIQPLTFSTIYSGTQGLTTASNIYSVLNLEIPSGASTFSHSPNIEASTTNSSAGSAAITNIWQFLAQYAGTGSQPVTDLVQFDAGWELNLGGSAAYTNVYNFRATTPAITGTATVNNSVEYLASNTPAASVTGLNRFAAINIATGSGPYWPSTAYYSLAICSGCSLSEIDAPVRMAPVLGATSTAPNTSVQNTALRLLPTSADASGATITGILNNPAVTTGGAVATLQGEQVNLAINSGATATHLRGVTSTLATASGSAVTDAIVFNATVTNTGSGITTTTAFNCAALAGTTVNCVNDAVSGASDNLQNTTVATLAISAATGSAPGTSTVVLPTTVYGGGTVILTSPTAWCTITQAGTAYKVPCY